MNGDNDDSFPVCETISQSAESILKRSFAICRVDEDTSSEIQNAWVQARNFFQSNDDKISFHRVVNGHLHGFHVPCEAKMLFRAFCGSPSSQPWPNDGEFQNASEKVANKLHKLLLDCHEEMIQIKSMNCSSANGEGRDTPKRLKMTSPLSIPASALQTNNCPLDYFLYHGDKPNAVSCSEHVDRGVLICVCLTRVPGLEVLPRDSDGFICPELQTHDASLYRERQACSDLVCIMAGDQLRQIYPEVKACMHRVRNDLKQSRLSITYELRASWSELTCLT